jgi:hypothetical protein
MYTGKIIQSAAFYSSECQEIPGKDNTIFELVYNNTK